jgi:predicted helicase
LFELYANVFLRIICPFMSEKTIHDILAQFREEALNNRHLGDCFERLIARYLQLDPLFADRFSNVWMWNEWPLKGNTGDIGIDLVGEERATGEFCAIQCKFYLPEHTISQSDIDSFFAALGNAKFSSGLIISTTDKWGSNAEKRLANPSKPVNRLRIQDLDESPIDWSNFSLTAPNQLALKTRRTPRPHTRKAIDDVKEGLAAADRGKLIMACGTGKTYTSLCIAEEMCPAGHILFLVPSLSLLTQALREWTAHAQHPIHAMAVCSDVNIGQRKQKTDDDSADYQLSDLSFPATTSARALAQQYGAIRKAAEKSASQGLTVVFSTYHSIASVAEAQKAGLPEFDLIICDEAHRTTGVTLMGQDESHFVKVHDADFIKAKKRLYMTATPRLYGDEAKSKAAEASAELCSMDDVAYFGEELHRLGFGEAVGKNLLSDYKVLVLAVDEKYVNSAFQTQIRNTDNELTLDDAVKITGCWNGLAKRLDNSTATAIDFQGDTAHMTRAVAFSRSIKESKAFVKKMADLIEAYKADHPDEENILTCELDHVDGSFNAIARNRLLDWLKEPAEPNRCRILSNARCLSEGVDVPMLDAVLFLHPRNSIVDVVQSVGRVMRKPPQGSKEKKTYGYIILPIGIPAGVAPEEALKDNQKYKVVWQVLQALRAHDDRFNATINQIELNQKAPDNLQIIGVGAPDSGGDGSKSDGDGKDAPGKVKEGQAAFHFPELDAWKDALYAKIVLKCGSRRYWEDWAKDVAKIAQRHSDRIRLLLEEGNPKHTSAFAAFLNGLHQNINPSISQEDGIEMLSQHLITRPVFDALFENYAFSEANPISRAMQSMLDALDDQALEKETASLDKFYASVRARVEGIDNAEGKQKVITELYDKFFKEAFPKMSERLGIVYTPIPIVDFIILSIEDVLNQEFKTSLAAENVHLIDPFTGTGTFIVRLLQLAVERGIIKPKDLLRKYQHELHANEIVLLAYYIAAINIEETFHTLQKEAAEKVYAKGENSSLLTDHSTLTTSPYVPFDGIVLTDTFQLSESRNEMEEKMFPENNKRVSRQRKAPIRVVAGNPPYSSGQTSENDGNKNLKYPNLDERIRTTYAEKSTATLKNSLYDSYVRAIRWASDRIADQGIVAFVTNGSFIDGNAMDGLRACLADEFTTLYIFNLRGNQRTSGELSRQEGGKIFGSGSRTPVAISILVRNPAKKGTCELFYRDIGDYLNREEKLGMISDFSSIMGLHRKNAWQRLKPNEQYDWINLRDPAFDSFLQLGSKEKDCPSVFLDYSSGIKTNRDIWCYGFSEKGLVENMRRMLDFYNEQVESFEKFSRGKSKNVLADLVDEFIDTDPKRISWTVNLKGDLRRMLRRSTSSDFVRTALYRPFCKHAWYSDRGVIERPGLMPKLLSSHKRPNIVLCLMGPGASKDFSVVATDTPPDYELISKGQCFPLYLYEKAELRDGELSLDQAEGEVIDGYRRRHAITDGILAEFRRAYGQDVSKDDIFYYVYGILHSPEYRSRFASDLKKMLPRIPLTKETADYQAFTQAGRDLAHWHLNYETIEPYPLKELTSELGLDPWKQFHVTKMTFAKPTPAQKAEGLKADKTRIIYNAHLTLDGIPLEAYDYIVNGKPALEWIIERYQITIDKASTIKNDPNDWCKEHNNPRYIVDLLKRVTRVSLETMKIVNALPALNERK